MSEELKDKALKVIEFIAMNHWDRPEAIIYRISHIANGECENPHWDWVEELNQLYDKLKAEGEI
jgi:hypothetical protein